MLTHSQRRVCKGRDCGRIYISHVAAYPRSLYIMTSSFVYIPHEYFPPSRLFGERVTSVLAGDSPPPTNSPARTTQQTAPKRNSYFIYITGDSEQSCLGPEMNGFALSTYLPLRIYFYDFVSSLYSFFSENIRNRSSRVYCC